MQTGDVRKHVQQVQRLVRLPADERRARKAAAEEAWATLLRRVATPLARQVADALRAESIAVTLYTPKSGLRLALDHHPEDYVELGLDTSGRTARVVGRTSLSRASQVFFDEHPVKPGATPDEVTEDDLLAFFLEALEPWFGSAPRED